jgi:potassium-transporting ATPase KdpC subunit
MKIVKSVWGKSLVLFLLLTLLCGVLYPLLVTGISQAFFPKKANGSILEVNGKKYGSELLAQQFTGNNYLWGRVMEVDTQTFSDDNGKKVMYAWPSNLNPASGEYKKLVQERIAKIRAANPEMKDTPIPEDLVTCSASGLDPGISPAAADYQVRRVAKNRNRTEQQIRAVIQKYTTGRFLGIFGEETVNVLKVNLALDGILK